MDPETAWFILVEREHTHSVLIGPYEDKNEAAKEMNDGLYVQSLADEDALEIMIVELLISTIQETSIVYELPPEYDVGNTMEEHGIGVFAHGPQETM